MRSQMWRLGFVRNNDELNREAVKTFDKQFGYQEQLVYFKKNGYSVYTNEKVPCGDGGIALGQIFLAE